MDKPNYEFIDDDEHGMLKIIIRNHWDVATAERFRDEVRLWWGRILRNRARHRHSYLLIDASDHGVQSQEVVRQLCSDAAAKEKIFHRTAIIVSGTVQQIQARRVRSSSDDHRICASEAEALAWLFAAADAPVESA